MTPQRNLYARLERLEKDSTDESEVGSYVIIREPGWTKADLDREIAERIKRGVRPTNSRPLVIFDA